MFWKKHVDQLRGRGYSSKDKTEQETVYAYTEANEKNLNKSSEADNGAVSDVTTTDATQNKTGTSTTSGVVSARRYPDRV